MGFQEAPKKQVKLPTLRPAIGVFFLESPRRLGSVVAVEVFVQLRRTALNSTCRVDSVMSVKKFPKKRMDSKTYVLKKNICDLFLYKKSTAKKSHGSFFLLRGH